MHRRLVRWLIAIAITLSAAVYQRMTGPTHPLRGSAELAGASLSYRLPRSHDGEGDQAVSLKVTDTSLGGELIYRRYPTDDPWTHVPMVRDGDALTASLPHQPPAGKLEYYVVIDAGDQPHHVPAGRTAVIRFKGHVPLGILIPHILMMFCAMLFSNAAGVEAAAGKDHAGRYALIATGCLALGGMTLGPIIQKLAFGDLWTGIPFGYDLTDNKTLVAFVFWVGAATLVLAKKPNARWFILAAALMLLVVYSIPHSAMGSELNYQTGKVKTGCLPSGPPRVGSLAASTFGSARPLNRG